MVPFFYKYSKDIEAGTLSDGIKIRNLDKTTVVSANDVLIIDKDGFGDNSLTYHIEYDDFRRSIFTGDVNFDGTVNLTGDLVLGGDITINGTTTLNDVNVSGDLVVDDIIINGSNNLFLGDLKDVNTSGVADQHYLMYNGTEWVPSLMDTTTGGGTQTEDFILLSGGGDPIVFFVEVRPKSDWNQFKGIGSDDCFWIGRSPDQMYESPVLMLPPNRKFIFRQVDTSNAGRAIAFFEEQSEGSIINSPSQKPGVESPTGTPGVDGETVIEFTTNFDANLIIQEQTPQRLYYRCLNATADDKYMGNVIHNLGNSHQEDIGDIGGGHDGGGFPGFPFALDLKEALEELDNRVTTLENSP